MTTEGQPTVTRVAALGKPGCGGYETLAETSIEGICPVNVEPMTEIEPAYLAWEPVSTYERVFA